MMDTMTATRMVPVVVEEAMQSMSEWKSVFRMLWEETPLSVNMTNGGNADEVKKLGTRIKDSPRN